MVILLNLHNRSFQEDDSTGMLFTFRIILLYLQILNKNIVGKTKKRENIVDVSKEKEEIFIVASIEKIAEQLIHYAYMYHISDVHIIPREEDAVVQVRMGKELVIKEVMSKRNCERLIAHFKFLGGMDIGEKRKPQSGSLVVTIHAEPISLRFSTLPTFFEESLVIRILPQNHITPLDQLSLFPGVTRKLISLLKHSHGLIIFTGPTGSGKTTTLYTLLHQSRKMFNRNIITLEDPIECRSDGVLQVQVNEKAGITYSTGLRAILRHDPDIIMVGEIRDDETAQIAVRAALTGHPVCIVGQCTRRKKVESMKFHIHNFYTIDFRSLADFVYDDFFYQDADEILLFQRL